MVTAKSVSDPVYQQDMLSFELDPSKIVIKNNRPLLYQSVRAVSYTHLDVYKRQVY